MILATSDTDSIDPFPTLQALMGLLEQYRDVSKDTANIRINALIHEQCGKQTQQYTFKGARLEADLNEAYPGSLPTDLRVRFLLTDEQFEICTFIVTADFGAKLQGKFN